MGHVNTEKQAISKLEPEGPAAAQRRPPVAVQCPPMKGCMIWLLWPGVVREGEVMKLSDEQIRALVDHWAARLELAEIAGELTADEVRAQAEIAMAWAREKLGRQP